MARTRRPRKREAEKRFPHHVDVPVPVGVGLGGKLNFMLAWCRVNVTAGQWDYHRHSHRVPGQAAADSARFYFMTEADADKFKSRWFSH